MSEMIDQLEKIALEYINFETYIQYTKGETKQNQKDLDDVLAGKKSVEEIDLKTNSMNDLPSLTNQFKSNNKASLSTVNAHEDEDGSKFEEDRTWERNPYKTYDHDFTTYHVGQRKTSFLDAKKGVKRISNLIGKSRKAPFVLAEINGRHQEKVLNKIKTNPQQKHNKRGGQMNSGQINIE